MKIKNYPFLRNLIFNNFVIRLSILNLVTKEYLWLNDAKVIYIVVISNKIIHTSVWDALIRFNSNS